MTDFETRPSDPDPPTDQASSSRSTPTKVTNKGGDASVHRRGQVVPWLKESIAAVLALSISATAIWMLVSTYNTVSEPVTVDRSILVDSLRPLYDAQERARLETTSGQKDIMMVAIGLLGSILGYYFGRIPAEHRAERAESAAEEAEETASTAVASASAAGERAAEERRKRADSDRKVEDARHTVKRLLPSGDQPGERRRGTLGADDDSTKLSDPAVTSQLEALIERLR